MYVGTVVSLKKCYVQYLLKQKAQLIPTTGNNLAARLGDHTFNYQATEQWWKEQSGEFDNTPEVQSKLNTLIKGIS